jgi:nucleotide-binding universal stress UspA family protein
MNPPLSNKLLVCIDGSDRSILTMNYLAGIAPLRQMKINLFNVFSQAPESFYDLRKDPAVGRAASQLNVWEISQRQLMQAHMDKCRQILVEAGFDPENIQIKIHRRRQGIARDILAEAQNGYTAVVLRRRGMSNLQGLIVGSVAYKLIHYLTFVPLIFAGRKPFNHRILIAVDGSAGALRAVDFIGRVLSGGQYQIGLLGVYREDWPIVNDDSDRKAGEQFKADALAGMGQALDAAHRCLLNAGWADKLISTQVVTDSASRAGAIVDFANRQEFNTVVLGRKGISRVRKFALGRVGSKILHVGREHSLWVVS